MKNFLNTISKLPAKLTGSSGKIQSLISKTAKSAMMALGISTAAHALPSTIDTVKSPEISHTQDIEKSNVSIQKDWLKNNKQNYPIIQGIRLDPRGNIDLNFFSGKVFEYHEKLSTIESEKISVRNHGEFREVIYTLPSGRAIILATTSLPKKSDSNGISDESFLVNQILNKVPTGIQRLPDTPKKPFSNDEKIAFSRPENPTVVTNKVDDNDEDDSDNHETDNKVEDNDLNIIDGSAVDKNKDSGIFQTINTKDLEGKISSRRRVNFPIQQIITPYIPKFIVPTILRDFQSHIKTYKSVLDRSIYIQKDIGSLDFLDTEFKEKFKASCLFWKKTIIVFDDDELYIDNIEFIRAHKSRLRDFFVQIGTIKRRLDMHGHPQKNDLMEELNRISTLIPPLTTLFVGLEIALLNTLKSK